MLKMCPEAAADSSPGGMLEIQNSTAVSTNHHHHHHHQHYLGISKIPRRLRCTLESEQHCVHLSSAPD